MRRHIASVPPRHFVRLAGAALYDGLVGAAARRHNLLLITCDHRAAPTYRALGVDYELLSPVSL